MSAVNTALAATSFILDRELVIICSDRGVHALPNHHYVITFHHQVLGVGGASGGHDNSSDVTVTSEELPLDPQRMTMVTEITLKIHHFSLLYCRIFTSSSESAPEKNWYI